MTDPTALSLTPVIVAIGLALATRQVVPSLLAGTVSAALIIEGGDPWQALVHTVDPLILDAIADRDHVKVTLFSLLIAGMVALLSRLGATTALVDAVAGRARTRRGGMVTVWLSGMVVFFDDYANCLVVGTATRPLTDRLRISREKLAYLVDSTAAPMATLALVSTWIGYEVGLIDDALQAAGQDENAYAFFMAGLPYRFYPWLALIFAGAIAFTGRDFGPMHAAETRAARGPAPTTAERERHPALAWLAILPVATLVGVTGASLWLQGSADAAPDAALFEIIGGADGYDAMLHGSIAALTLALGLGAITRAAPVTDLFKALMDGMRELFEPLTVLFLAWALASGIGELNAADYLVGLLGGAIPGAALPTVVFLLSAAVAFATGTSFGTMGVLLPLVIPLAFSTAPEMALAASSAVLAGATWGDHCSPISDTTVLSSTGAGCEHTAHVVTQLPYALAAGGLSIALCSIPAGLGLSPWLCLLLGAAGCVAVVRFVGRPTVA